MILVVGNCEAKRQNRLHFRWHARIGSVSSLLHIFIASGKHRSSEEVII